MNAEDRASYLQTSKSLAHAHTSVATGGQTAAPPAEDRVDLHFVAYVRDPQSQRLFELDGRRKGPVDRLVDVPSQEDLLKVATNWVKENYVRVMCRPSMPYEGSNTPSSHSQMALNPDKLDFNLVALASVD